MSEEFEKSIQEDILFIEECNRRTIISLHHLCDQSVPGTYAHKLALAASNLDSVLNVIKNVQEDIKKELIRHLVEKESQGV